MIQVGKYAVPREQGLLPGLFGEICVQWEDLACFKDLALNLEHFLDVLIDKSFMKSYPLNLNITKKIYAIKDEFQ